MSFSNPPFVIPASLLLLLEEADSCISYGKNQEEKDPER
jgi:hypothetical protein